MDTSVFASTERISMQTDNFGNKLEVIVAQICEDIRAQDMHGKNLDGYPLVKKLEQTIFFRTGIRVEIITTELPAAILPFYSNKNHIFLNDWLRGNISIREQNKVINQMGARKGWVNLNEARIGGVFSDYKHPLYLNFSMLTKDLDLNPSEITAALLHELGHAFTACYFADRTDRTNQVLANLLRTLSDHDVKSDIEYTYRELSKVTDQVTKEEVDKIVNGNRVIAGAAWFKAIVAITRSQLKDDKYSDTAFEEQADGFASRFGYGKGLVATLEKIHKGDVNKCRSARTIAYLMEYAVFAALCGMILSILVGAPLVIGVYALVMKMTILSASGEDSIDYTYDKLIDRYKRIRQDTIDILKNKALSKDTVKEMLDAVYAMDDAIKSTTNYKSVYNLTANFLFSASRKALDSIEAQKLMETLANNELFVNAAEFRHA